ncbi:MAG: hypothetical protein Q9163_000557 [Psora crenata]
MRLASSTPHGAATRGFPPSARPGLQDIRLHENPSMPTFYASGTTVQLSTATLKNVTTASPLQCKCPQATKEVEGIAYEFSRASRDCTLAEDILEDEFTGSHLRFLGKNREFPFFMVRGGKNFFDQGSDRNGQRTKRPARVPPVKQTVEFMAVKEENTSKGARRNGACRLSSQDVNNTCGANHIPPPIPRALCLTVFLSPATFIQSNVRKARQTVYHDVKIDVFFNGSLNNSTIVSSRYRNDVNDMTEHIVRFTGRRLGRLLEKPWIVNPPYQVRGPHAMAKSPFSSPMERWERLSIAILREANNLGRNAHGARPALGEYLESLASLSPPDVIEAHDFGVIDVVITYGRGAKLGPDTLYLTEPTPIKLLDFEQHAEPVMEQLEPSRPQTDAVSSQNYIKPATLPVGDPLVMETTTRSSKVYRSISTSKPNITPKTPGNLPRTINHVLPHLGDSDSPVTEGAFSALVGDNLELQAFLKRPSKMTLLHSGDTPMIDHPLPPERSTPRGSVSPSFPFSDEVSRRQAASALMHLSMPCAANPSFFPPLVTCDYEATTTSSPAIPLPATIDPTLRPASIKKTSSMRPLGKNSISRSSSASSRLTSPPSELLDLDFNAGGDWTVSQQHSGPSRWVTLKYFRPLSSHPSSGSTDISPFKPPKAMATRGRPRTPNESPTPTQQHGSRTPRRRGTQLPEVSATATPDYLDKDFVPGDLSEGCRIGYAEPGVVRTIGSVRGGWFREVGVVMGVRFIIG